MTNEPNGTGLGLSVTEVVESLTGYDEAAIEKNFGAAVEQLQGAKFIRALLFGHFLHQGVEAKNAHKQVMAMTQAAVGEYFRDEEDTPDAPIAPPPAPPGPPSVELAPPAGDAPAAPAPDPVDPAAGDPAAGVPPLPARSISDSPQA